MVATVDKRLRIAFDHGAFSIQEYGGISRYFVRLAVELSRNAEIDLTVDGLFTCNKLIQNSSDLRGATLYVPKFQGYRRILPRINNALSAGLYGVSAPDILHQTSPAPVQIRARNAKRVVTVHDMVHELFPGHYRGTEFSKRKRLAVYAADGIVAVSERTKRDIVDVYGIDPASISVVHHGVEEPPNVPPARFDRPYILYVGQRDLYKNFELLLNAVANNKSLASVFYIVAFGGDAFTNTELQQIARSGLHGKVFHRSGNDSALWSYYRGATAFVFPSKYEGFGMPLLEAMAASCPVLCSNASCFPEVAGDAALFFDPESVESLMDALTKMLFDSSLRAAYTLKGQARARSFSWNLCASKTMELYKSIHD